MLIVSCCLPLLATAADTETPIAAKPSSSGTRASTTETSKKTNADKTNKTKLEFLEYLGAMESDEDNWTDIAVNKPAVNNSTVNNSTATTRSTAVAKTAIAKTAVASKQSNAVSATEEQ
jgi:hypothetical protein